MMRAIGTVSAAAIVFVAAASTAVPTQAQPAIDQTQTTQAPFYDPTTQAPPAPESLFNIGRVPIDVWAPVEPPYDAHMDRNLASDPLWEAGAQE